MRNENITGHVSPDSADREFDGKLSPVLKRQAQTDKTNTDGTYIDSKIQNEHALVCLSISDSYFIIGLDWTSLVLSSFLHNTTEEVNNDKE